MPDFKNEQLKFLCVVGARKYTTYGQIAVEKLISGLRGYPIVIISGLALGIDALAHEAALAAGLTTIAVPGSGLDPAVLYPRTNVGLAERILKADGSLLSEFEDTFRATVWSFPQRNRIMAGLAHAVLVVEAERQSGSLITARLATDYNRDVLVVPGPITQSTSEGPHLFLRLGATPITSAHDILEALHLDDADATPVVSAAMHLSPEEERVWDALVEPKTKDELATTLNLPIASVSALLSLLELRRCIKEADGRIIRI